METLNSDVYCELFKYLPLSTIVSVVELGFAENDGLEFIECVKRFTKKATVDFKGAHLVEIGGRQISPTKLIPIFGYFTHLQQLTIISSVSSLRITAEMNEICVKCTNIVSIELICDKMVKFEFLESLSNVFAGKIKKITLPSIDFKLDRAKRSTLVVLFGKAENIKKIVAQGFMARAVIKVLTEESFDLVHLNTLDFGRIKNLHLFVHFVAFCGRYGQQLKQIKYMPDHVSAPIHFFASMFRSMSELRSLHLHNEIANVCNQWQAYSFFKIIARNCEMLEELTVKETRLFRESISDYIKLVSKLSNLQKIRLNFNLSRWREQISIASLVRCTKLIVFEITLIESQEGVSLDLNQVREYCPRLEKFFTKNLTIINNEVISI
jgi:hypothetical protein